MRSITIPAGLQHNLGGHAAGRVWLAELPQMVASFVKRWQLRLEAPFEHDVTGAWVAPCQTPEHPMAVFKLGWPHYEATWEIDGLAAWRGEHTVHLLDHDRSRHALLLERLMPGHALSGEDAMTQDREIGRLLPLLWSTPPPPGVAPLTQMIERWVVGAQARIPQLPAAHRAMVAAGMTELRTLAVDPVAARLLATDLHAGNVLAGTRRPWVVIDPKPFVGDPCYDLTQHLLNIKPRLESEGSAVVKQLAAATGVDAHRVWRWLFARLCLQVDDVALARKVSAWSL
ncbi:MAG: aminoglycoside phosphotransferase family protein [Pseudomonadota bacterium]